VVAICHGPGDDPQKPDRCVVVQRGAASTFDCGAWLKDLCAKRGGRGGGRPERAEGRVAGGIDPAEIPGVGRGA
jgi:hypothetical protein